MSMIIDFVGCYAVEKGCKALFASLEPAEMVTRGRERREARRLTEEQEAERKRLAGEVTAEDRKTQ